MPYEYYLYEFLLVVNEWCTVALGYNVPTGESKKVRTNRRRLYPNKDL